MRNKTLHIRYVKQSDNYGCGPIAILNALKWSGYRATIKSHYRDLLRRCKTRDPDGDEYSGTLSEDFQKTLKYASKNKFTTLFVNQISLSRVEKELAKGNSIILLHLNLDGTSHFSFIIDQAGPDFITVNSFKASKSVTLCKRNVMRFWTRRRNYFPQAWIISKPQV